MWAVTNGGNCQYGMVFGLNSHKSLNTFVDDSDTYSALKGGK